MCNGTIMDKLITFSVPLMLSSVLQLMFNAVDIIVVGRFSGSQALAAVGSTTALINIFVNLFIGISLGANVLAARFYALELKKEMSETVHTAITFALVSGIVVAVFGVTLARFALEIMATPEDVINKSVLYMRIYFCGMPFFMLYNYGAAVLRAVGDTKRPLLFLIISGVVNAVLNLFLVIVFHLDVAGVGIATVISQCISCILVLRCLYHTESSYQLRFSKLCPENKISESDLCRGSAGRNSEHGYQSVKCHAAVIRQFLWVYCHGRLYGSQQYSWIPVCIHQLRDTGMHELHQPELWCEKMETNGQGVD